jgi:DNA-binding transcriptional regulator YdaS (Cro superfamily)
MKLKTYLKAMPVDERKAFAERCRTTIGHLSNVAYGCRSCSAPLAMAIERESGAQVTVEEMCPNVDWSYFRSPAKPKTSRRVA